MAKKVLSPEEYQEKMQKKKEKRARFSTAFLKAVALSLGCALLFCATVVSYNRMNSSPAVVPETKPTNSEKKDNNNVDWDAPAADDNKNEPSESGDNKNENNSQGENNGDNKNEETKKPLSTKREQFDYFVKSFNNVKTNAKTVTNVWKKGSNYKSYVDLGSLSFLNSTVQGLMSSLLKEETPNAEYTGEDIKANFPPVGTTCNLKTDDIQDLKFEEDGDYYIVTITCKKETNPTAGSGIGAIANALTKEAIKTPIANIPLVNKLEPTCAYENVKCEAKIEKATGNMVEYYFDMPLILSFETQNLHIGLEFEERWTVAY